MKRACAVAVMVAIYIVAIMPGVDANQINKIQSYAGHVLTPLEFSAALVLWQKESNWNIRARNGLHYGLCQGRSKYMARANYKQQVRWCVSYAYNRYGSMALALKHWRQYGWH